MNRQTAIFQAPAADRVAISRGALAALPAALLLTALVYGAGLYERRDYLAAAPVDDRPGWFHADVVDTDSPQARVYRDRQQLPVRLPDSSAATVVTSAGQPRALLLPPSNVLADGRERALQAGAAQEADRSLLLPALTEQGERIDFVIDQDGSAIVSAPRYADPAQR